ncbi:hypothetical protein GO009_16980, partial [Muricauda sp. TY007]|uniref:hypothetical protein n=1 Tax=Allomuricauda sp. TY007 TaxID=2683200 RepID=UPI0013BFCE70
LTKKALRLFTDRSNLKVGHFGPAGVGHFRPASYGHFNPARVVYYVRRFQEKTLTIGKSFRLDNFLANKEKRKAVKLLRPIQKVGNLFTAYLKSNLSNGFSNLYSKNSTTNEYEFNSNIGLGLKYTYVFNGKISSGEVEKIDYIRQNYVKKEVAKSLKKYNSVALNKDVTLKDFDNRDNELIIKESEEKQIVKKYFEFYESIIDEELKYIESEKLIKTSHLSWFSIDAYLPLTERIIKHSLDSLVIDKRNFRDYNFSGTFNYLFAKNTNGWGKDWSSKLTIESGLFKTNNFKVSNQTAATFQNIVKDNITTVVEGDSDSVFLGDYDDAWATAVKMEGVLLLFNNSMGLSASIESIQSSLKDYKNWKLGIPFSLKDKDNKPTVNFELQWREVSASHFVGISVGYNFGKFVK